MQSINHFVSRLKHIGWSQKASEQLICARKIVSEINHFLFETYDELGSIDVLGQKVAYFSEFHKFWNQHHKEILGVTIHNESCEKVCDALYQIYRGTSGNAFNEIYPTEGLSADDIAKVRLLTGNQDFRGSRNFSKLAAIYERDPSRFDLDLIISNPDDFVKALGFTNLSQGDKRSEYAKTFARFVKEHGGTPMGLIRYYQNDIARLREAMISCIGAGYGNKKTDMVLRDMVVGKVWNDATNFEVIDVASDINTIRIALRTGILRTAMPLVSSFLDQFCSQYGYIDSMNALAWRKVWEIWCEKYPTARLPSPACLDYFIYRVIGKQFCKKILAHFQCENGHSFRWHSSRNRTCQVCYKAGQKGQPATLVRTTLPCECEDGSIAIKKSEYVKSGNAPSKLSNCPFKEICCSYSHKRLQPPKSISIFGRTGWLTAYAYNGNGGGGLMA